MSADEAHRRRKSSRRRRRDSTTPHTSRKKDETSVLPESESTEIPSTLEDLREARLKYLATPQAERTRRMRYEYSRAINVEEAAKTEAVKERSSESKAKRSRKSRTKSTKAEPGYEDEDSQYVYGPSRSKQHVPGAFESQQNSPEDRAEKSRVRTTSTRATRSKTERSYSEPATRHKSTSSVVKGVTSSRPQLHKSVTALPERPRPSARPSSTTKSLKPDVSTVAAAPTMPKKSGSIFGSIFSPKPQPTDRKVSCLTCGDDVVVSRSAKLPCAHRMCHSCLKRIFKLSVSDPAHMPPRCCSDQAISLKHVDTLFDQDFKKNYNRKFKEFSTKNKIYCPARTCGQWIQPKHITLEKGRKVGRCSACKTLVCGICSQKMHRTRDCPKDPATKEFVETAKKAGWQKCYNCSAMVELKEGCNHMTCRCTAEFCMMCGLKWKSCDCPWFTYENVDTNGDPVRYQQELDRRREQERRDEDIARRMEALQVDDERPALAEWFQLGNGAGRGRHQNIHNAREALRAEFAGHHTFHDDPVPVMPGGWDDGPRQFEHILPPLPQPLPRRHHREALDPAALDPGLPRIAERNAVPIFQQPRAPRRRGTVTDTSIFEGRALTIEERDQQRRIRAWATSNLDDR